MRRREHISCPYLAWNGFLITCQARVDEYNATQDQINTWIDAGRPVPEWLLDWSHKQFVAMTRPC